MGSRKKLLIIGGIVVAAAAASAIALWSGIAGDGRFTPLAEADRYELFSLEPQAEAEDGTPGYFHRYKILGSTLITDARTRETLNNAFRAGVMEGAEPAKCFWPRHGIRVSKGGVTTDYAICFECRQIHVFEASGRNATWTTSNSPEPVFDKVLKDAGVKLAEKAK